MHGQPHIKFIVISGLLNETLPVAQVTTSSDRMNVNHELKNTLKEAVLAQVDVTSRRLSGKEMRKITKTFKMAGVQTVIRKTRLQNTSQKCFILKCSLGFSIRFTGLPVSYWVMLWNALRLQRATTAVYLHKNARTG